MTNSATAANCKAPGRHNPLSFCQLADALRLSFYLAGFDTHPVAVQKLARQFQLRTDLGRFRLPKVYKGEWRVDTHPRFSPDSRYVCTDAPVKGQGRQLHLIDISRIVKS